MKKNITINLFGSLYNIDEDACELLEKYLENMKAYFSRKEGGEEIAEDIECRVAEILAEKKAAGTEAITIEHIEEIIQRIGNPEQMDEETPQENADGTQTPPPPPPPSGRATKRFFRDPEDKMLGGVLSGLAHYFGGTDPLPWRIIFVILCVVTWSGLAVIYLVLWALIPEAKTTEERLMMYGKPVNTQTLNEEIMRGVEKTKAFIQNPERQSQATGCLTGVLRFIVICFKAMIIFFFGAMLFGVVSALFYLIVGGFMGETASATFGIHDSDFRLLLDAEPSLRWWLLALGLMGLTVVVMPLYAVIKSLFRRSESKPASRGRRTAAILIWILVAAGAFTLSFITANIASRGDKKVCEIREAEDRIENTRDGRYLYEGSWDFLDNSGWQLLQLDGAEDNITTWRGAIFENEADGLNALGLSQKAPSVPMKYNVVQTLDVRPGHYRVVALVNTDGQGNAFYAKGGDKILHHVDVLPTPGDSATAALAELVKVYGAIHVDDGEEVDDVLEGWHAECYDFDVPTQTTLQYGFSNLPEYSVSPWTAKYFNVAYMNIRRIGENKP